MRKFRYEVQYVKFAAGQEMPLLKLIRLILAWRLFARPQEAAGAWDIIKWWELRRIPYNAIVGATGVFTLLLIFAAVAIREQVSGVNGGSFFLLPFLVIAYAFAANVCYTGGWVVEIVVRKIWGERAGAFGEISFALGLVFSVLLTLVPGGLVALVLGLQLLLP